MALNIKDRRTDELAREVAALSGKSITEALRETLELRVVALRDEKARRKDTFLDTVRQIQAEAASIPDRDTRSVKEIRDSIWEEGD